MEIPSNPSNVNNDSYGSSQTDQWNPVIMQPSTTVLLVDHNTQSLNSTAKMLEQCSHQVTKVKLAASAVKIILSGKKHFDVVMADLDTPDISVIQRLLEESLQRDILVILTGAQDDPYMAYNALENGAFLFIQKPANAELMKYLWQFVTRERLQKNCREMLAKMAVAGENNGINITEGPGKASATNGAGGGVGEENTGEGAENAEVSCQNSTGKRKDTNGDEFGPSLPPSAPEPNPSDNCNKKKVCTEWTKELHRKFIDAVHQLGEGKCYPKEILEIMQVPGLTRMQVASHLQKCRLACWRAPEQRKHRPRKREPSSSKQQAEAKAKLRRFGTMPSLESKSKGRGQQNSELPIISSVPSDNTNTVSIDPENGETSIFPSDDIDQELFDIMEFLNRDPLKFPIWQRETSPEVWNETSVPSPSAATTTDFGMDCYYPLGVPTFESATAAAMGSNVSDQQTTDDLSFDFDDGIDINSLVPEFLDLTKKESKPKNHIQAQSNGACVPSDEAFPRQANYMQGDIADASKFQP